MILFMLLPITAFILLFLLFYAGCRNVSASIARTWMSITLFVWAMTELLSLFRLWTGTAAVLSWILVLAVLCFLFIRKQLPARLRQELHSRSHVVQTLKQHKICILTMGMFFLFVTVTALLRSQNLIDSLVYRLPRIMHWIQNQSVGYYASGTDLQIRYPALTEYLVAQFYLLGCPDRIANIVHVCAYSCSAVMVYGISRKLHLTRGSALFASWIYLLIPVAIIQTYTIQSDIISGLYLLIFVDMILDFIQTPALKMDKGGFFSAVELAGCVMLAYLCKPTVCFIMVVFFLWMAATRLLKRDRFCVLLKYVAVGAVTAVLLYLPLFSKNLQSYSLAAERFPVSSQTADPASDNSQTPDHDPTGSQTASNAENIMDGISNSLAPDSFHVVRALTDPAEFFMTCVQNLGRNAASICLPKYNELIDRVVGKLGGMLHYDVSDFEIQEDGSGFFGETSASNPAIMIFTAFLAVCVLLRLSKTNRLQTGYVVCAISGLILQSALMGFSLYRSRYLLGIMAVLCPAFALCIEMLKTNAAYKQRIMTVLIVLAGFGGLNALSYQLSYMADGLRGESIHQYFVWNTGPEYYYDLLTREINERGYKTIGLNGKVALEYVLWKEIDDYDRIESVNVNPQFFPTIACYEDTSFIPECLVEENPYEVLPGNAVECHGRNYTCVWVEFGNNKYYSIYELTENN